MGVHVIRYREFNVALSANAVCCEPVLLALKLRDCSTEAVAHVAWFLSLLVSKFSRLIAAKIRIMIRKIKRLSPDALIQTSSAGMFRNIRR